MLNLVALMLEFIGFITICFIIFKILTFYLKNKSSVNSVQYGDEIRYFSINELNIPSNYFNYITGRNIESIKNKAIHLKESNPVFKNVEWTRLMAASIYLSFNKDCQSIDLDSTKSIFEVLKIEISIIEKELESNPYQIVRHFLQAGKNYEFSTDDEIKNLILECSKVHNRKISYPMLYDRISALAYDNYTTEFFGDHRGLWFFPDDIDDKIHSVIVEALEPEKGDASSIYITVNMEKK